MPSTMSAIYRGSTTVPERPQGHRVVADVLVDPCARGICERVQDQNRAVIRDREVRRAHGAPRFAFRLVSRIRSNTSIWRANASGSALYGGISGVFGLAG